MNKEKLEEVLRFMLPIFNYSIKEIFKKRTDVLNEIKKGSEGRDFSIGKMKYEFNKLEEEKGKEWTIVFKRQLKIFYDTLRKQV